MDLTWSMHIAHDENGVVELFEDDLHDAEGQDEVPDTGLVPVRSTVLQ